VAKALLRLVSLLGLLAVALGLLGSGSASADNELAGLTYEKAQQSLRGRGVIASRVGEYLPTDQCVVTGSRRATFSDASGRNRGKVLLHLNCHDPMTDGHPGFSAASPQGQKAQQLKDRAERLSNNYAAAVKKGVAPACEPNFKNCQRICEQSGACSPELLKYLGL